MALRGRRPLRRTRRLCVDDWVLWPVDVVVSERLPRRRLSTCELCRKEQARKANQYLWSVITKSRMADQTTNLSSASVLLQLHLLHHRHPPRPLLVCSLQRSHPHRRPSIDPRRSSRPTQRVSKRLHRLVSEWSSPGQKDQRRGHRVRLVRDERWMQRVPVESEGKSWSLGRVQKWQSRIVKGDGWTNLVVHEQRENFVGLGNFTHRLVSNDEILDLHRHKQEK